MNPQQMIRAEVEGVGTLEFPEGTDPSVIQATIKRVIAERSQTQPEPSTDRSFLRRVGSGMGNAVSGTAQTLWRVSGIPGVIREGPMGAIKDQFGVIKDVVDAQVGEYKKAKAAEAEGRTGEMIKRSVAAGVPMLGPLAAHWSDMIREGQTPEMLGEAIVSGALPLIRKPVLPKNLAAAAERGAVRRVTDVMSPKVGPNKTRFGNMAARVAPNIAQDLTRLGAPLTRAGLQRRVASQLDEATQALDAAADQRLSARSFETGPIVEQLRLAQEPLVVKAVDASRPNLETVIRKSPIVDDMGQPFTVAEKKVVPVGRNVIPSENQPRFNAIQNTIDELETLGPFVRYEPLRRVRQARDVGAEVVYNPSMTADFLKLQGAQKGAADSAAVLRDALAGMDEVTAAANKQYALYRTANDVLKATEEVSRSSPTVGRGLFGFMASPLMDTLINAGFTPKLKTAALLQRLANSARNNNINQAMRSSLAALTAMGGAQIANQQQDELLRILRQRSQDE